MKKFLTIVAAFALVLGLSQCRKPNAPTINGIGGTQHVVLQASFDNGGSKIAENGIGGLKWEDGENADQIVVKQGEKELGTLTCTNAENGTFVGDIETTTGNITFTFGEHLDLKEQTGELNDAISLTSGEVEYNPLGSYKNVNMTMAQENAILKFDLHSLVSKTSDVTITAAASAKGEAEIVAIVKDVTTEEKPLYVVIPVENPATEKEYTFEGDKGSFKKKMTLTANTYYTNNGQGGTVFTENYLCFTAKQAGSTVSMAKYEPNGGTAPAVNLEYSINGTAWNTFTVGTTSPIELPNIGDKVYFRAGSGGNNAFGCRGNNGPECHNYFVTTGDLSVSGNIMYLLNSTDPKTEMTSDNKYCFYGLFKNFNTSNPNVTISDASKLLLPATTLADQCYERMFYDCSNLTAVPELPATTLAEKCYLYMFYNCSKLTAAPELQATTLTASCYEFMFSSCTGLVTAPELPATTLAKSCYNSMFSRCTGLVTAPELPVTTLANYCYSGMFSGCTGLETAPVLPATTLVQSCYQRMFENCTKLSSVTMLATSVNANNCLYYWLLGAGTSAATRTVFVAPGMVDAVKATLPSNPDWNLIDFCFTAKQAGSTVSMAKVETGGTAPTVTLEYSINGTDWNTFTVGTTTVELPNKGDKVYFRAGDGGNKKLATLVNPNPTVITYNYFVTTGDLSVGGNIMYLLDGTTPATTLDTDNTCCFSYLFFNCTAISDFSQLQLPATALADYCYHSMFRGCTGLETAPALPATALADYCYHSMFRGCTGLKTAPALQATELADRCYCNMFYDCTGLKTAPALPATELADCCYYSMFQGCTELSSAPALPATTLASFCYRSMFQGCTKLTTAPELKATALQESCYLSMFQNCTNLTTAPELKATTLAKQCYQGMFYGCTKLSSVTMLATSVSATSCLQKWLENAGSDASVTSAKLYVDKTMTSNPTITGSLPSQKWSVAAGN